MKLVAALREKISRMSWLDKLCCYFNFHEKREGEGIAICQSCNLLISGNKERLEELIRSAEIGANESRIQHLESIQHGLAHENYYISAYVEDLAFLKRLNLVLEKLTDGVAVCQ